MKFKALIFASMVALAVEGCAGETSRSVVTLGVGGKSVTASNNYVAKSFSVGKFDKIRAGGVVSVVYTQKDGPQKVEVFTSDNLMQYVDVSVDGGTLTVGLNYNGSIKSLDKFEVRMSSPSLAGVDLGGAAKFKAAGGVTAGSLGVSLSGASSFTGGNLSCADLTADVSGAGRLSVGNLKARSASFGLSGAGKMDVNEQVENSSLRLSGASKAVVSGTAVDAVYSTSGAASIEAEECVARHVSASVSGGSKVKCHAAATLKAERSGAASISYKGNPKLIDVPSPDWLRKL